uniref:Uncharacterized protein n=1 Tax=Macaca fascicularis TaxID=9541 RepID=Q9BGP7_MACFA|nr:hypothetical protein [Macaca fascicularis]BAB60798.1 hypothetical protein [Macaca fascicularis]
MCWGYRGSEHLPHTGRTLAPMFTMLRETFGEQREASRGMGPHLSSIGDRACACPTSLLAAPWAAAPWQLELEGFSESAQPHRSPHSRGWALGGQSQGREEDRAQLTPQLSP